MRFTPLTTFWLCRRSPLTMIVPHLPQPTPACRPRSWQSFWHPRRRALRLRQASCPPRRSPAAAWVLTTRGSSCWQKWGGSRGRRSAGAAARLRRRPRRRLRRPAEVGAAAAASAWGRFPTARWRRMTTSSRATGSGVSGLRGGEWRARSGWRGAPRGVGSACARARFDAADPPPRPASPPVQTAYKYRPNPLGALPPGGSGLGGGGDWASDPTTWPNSAESRDHAFAVSTPQGTLASRTTKAPGSCKSLGCVTDCAIAQA